MAKIAIDFKSGNFKRDEECIVGIDLGTTNSLIAYIDNGIARCIGNENGQNILVPSIIHINSANEILIGDEAKNQLVIHPESTIYSVKRLMGKSFQEIASKNILFSYEFLPEQSDKLIKVKINEQFYTPVELSALILKNLKERGEKVLKKNISKAVITVPAYFNDNQRQATRDAGRLAGLEVLRIINEPTAASLAYGIGIDPDETKKILVYDLGGGTFDVSILQIEQGVFEVLATSGDNFLGGDDIDHDIMQHWSKKYNFIIPDDTKERNRLRLLAEEAKIALSEKNEFTKQFQSHSLSLIHDELKLLTEATLKKTIQLCKSAMSDAQLSFKDLDEILLIGGSTKMPLIVEGLNHFFGRRLMHSVNPDEAVALGAAVQADILSGNRKDLLLLDVTPLSLGIETMGGLMDVIIPRNSKIPTSLARNYTTSKDGQKKLKIAVFQGERDLVEHNRLLGEFILDNIPAMPAGLPKLEVKFQIDVDGILKITAKELRSGIEQSIEIKSQFNLGQDQIALMLKESLHFAQSDIQQKALIDAINEAEHIILSSFKFIEQNKSWLTQDENKKINQYVGELQISIENKNKNEIERAMEQLNNYAAPLAHKALDLAVNSSLAGNRIPE